MSEPPPAVEVREVTKAYDGGLTMALNGVSLTVARGEWVCLTGPSGCGKSTLLHLIAALDTPTSGSIVVNGAVLAGASLDRYRRVDIGLVFQFHNLLPNFTALQNVAVAMVGSGVAPAEQRRRAGELLGRVGLAGRERHLPTRLSGGERQRVAIARAFANGPGLILADEPTGALDSASTGLVLDLFRQMREAHGITLVLVTHDPNVAAAADRVVYMKDGRVVEPPAASPGALSTAPGSGA